MSIQDTIPLDKEGVPIRHPLIRALFWPLAILLITVLIFGIVRLVRVGKAGGVEVRNDPSFLHDADPQADISNPASVYASAQGKRYYYSTCKSTITDKNKVNFATAALAEAAVYTLATNCHQ